MAKHTQLEVTEARDGERLEPNHVFIAPSSGHLELFHGTLQLIPTLEGKSFHLPVDSFFRSLAEDQRERAICVILSGTGTDGTLGLRAVKGESGMVMVQEPESAKYAGMPQSAIATGMVDYVLPATELPSQLVAYVGGSYVGGSQASPTDQLALTLPKIFRQLRSRTGHDFSSYKSSTIRRRIERRMNVHQIESPTVYSGFLEEHPHEADQLFKELLIGVTNFFRDAEAFEELRIQVHKLLETKSEDDKFRAWVPGCATGEEAYSVAIVIHECLAALEKNLEVQVFGTDLDSDAIELARVGRYPEGIVGDIEPKRLRRYFVKGDNGFRIKKEIREMVVFAPQNMMKDPPFTKLDLLSCRNLLIYLNSDLQKRLFPIFHYALIPNGLLFLGPSETVGASQDLFTVESKKWKLFRRRESATAKHPEFPLTTSEHEVRGKAAVTRPKTQAARSSTMTDVGLRAAHSHCRCPWRHPSRTGQDWSVSGTSFRPPEQQSRRDGS